jgi:D-3-phosphoglycerate dehydrogenase
MSISPYASGKGVVVMGTPFESITTAERNCDDDDVRGRARMIPAANARTQAGEWPKKVLWALRCNDGWLVGAISAQSSPAVRKVSR